jgi:hypothetical protein
VGRDKAKKPAAPQKPIEKEPTPMEALTFIDSLLESPGIQWQGRAQARHVERCVSVLRAAITPEKTE